MFPVIASSGLDGLIKIWELASGQLVRTIDGGPGELCSFVLCPFYDVCFPVIQLMFGQ